MRRDGRESRTSGTWLRRAGNTNVRDSAAQYHSSASLKLCRYTCMEPLFSCVYQGRPNK